MDEEEVLYRGNPDPLFVRLHANLVGKVEVTVEELRLIQESAWDEGYDAKTDEIAKRDHPYEQINPYRNEE